jgi:O-acetyl-ADP-ribose deacetylase (regulator of RNase III)
MRVDVVLVDVNRNVVNAWRSVFADASEVSIREGSMLDQKVDAWVSPTNSRGSMDGGLDHVIKEHFGQAIQAKVQREIGNRHGSLLPVGHAICVSTGKKQPSYLISTPTMVETQEDVSETFNVALACAAAFQAVHMQNKQVPNSITSVALPGLGASTGGVSPELCADLMLAGYNLFREEAFDDFAAMRTALQYQLRELAPLLGLEPPDDE